MQFHSTKNQNLKASLEEAIFKSLPADNGLYMPDAIPNLPKRFLEALPDLSFNEIAEEVTLNLLGDDLTKAEVQQIVGRAFDFYAPVVPLTDDLYVLELFHGPSMAFKDFGARYMASLMSHFLSKSDKEIHILVATSGDTGGAVAQGFHGVPGIRVTILYPSGKVSEIQEKQLTTLGGNVTALEVNGTFDDCQSLVKQAFLDQELNRKFNLSSANSINISRLIPQSFYYFSAYAQLAKSGKPVVFSVPSGNFGNLSAGLLAWKMGLPVEKFIAATNLNNVVPRYLDSGSYHPEPSVATLSNAMDVGNPSNFVRLSRLLNDDLHTTRNMVAGYYFDDRQTQAAMREVNELFDYVVCPHTAVAYLGLKDFLGNRAGQVNGIFLSTAHPAKFLELVEDTLGQKITIPENLEKLLSKEKKSIKMSASFADFKSWLLQ
ncbi:threonine synthase [Ravibacter arvi]|uniref:Threonine synthase n=1 Tax=Ravibacter arvi TaxID=2051041 RepID=A0ABP8MA26_9BACT